MEKIDFVVTWVDGNDPEWLQERSQYMPKEASSASSANRFRDWGLMRYWFRSVEKYAPWVNHVYFVTCGHFPEWLNLEYPKLTLVKHTDYIPREYLPTYNTNVIELNMHRIKELSQTFVLFNDDVFLTDHVEPEDFFYRGLPREMAVLGQLAALDPFDMFPHMVQNNMAVINKYFSKKEVFRKYWPKFFSPLYGIDVLRNLLLLPAKYFSCFQDSHLTAAFHKSTFETLWEKEPKLMDRVGRNRFRTVWDVTDWLAKYWQFCTGQFYPQRRKFGKLCSIGDDPAIVSDILSHKYKVLCLNDQNVDLDFEVHQAELIRAFEEVLPEKSSFER